MTIHKPKVLCVGDLHMGVHQNRLPQLIDLANWLKSIMVEHKLKDIIIPGDIIHTREEVAVPVLETLTRFFEILQEFNIIISVGNHDCYYNNRSDIHSLTVLRKWENITVIDKPVVHAVFNKTIGFCPWGVTEAELPTCDVMFGHFDIQTFQMSGRKLSTHGFEPTTLLDKTDLVVTNHYHATQERKYDNKTILYLGSPYEQNWGEVGVKKGVYIIDIINNNYTFIENKISPKHIRIRLSELLALGTITEDIQKSINGNIIQFMVDQAVSPDDVDAINNTLQTFNPLEYTTQQEYSDKITISDVELEATGINIQSDVTSFIDTLNIPNKQEVQQYILNVLHKVENIKYT